MNKTKMLYLVTFLVGSLCSIGVTVNNFDNGGFYIPQIDFMYCTERTCTHEEAHRMDLYRNNISSTTEFKEAVIAFAVNNPTHAWSKPILAHETPWHEEYAQMWDSVQGNIERIPPELQRFF
jgi:hypothetical protein